MLETWYYCSISTSKNPFFERRSRQMALSTLNLSITTIYTARDALETARFELASGIVEYYVIDARKSCYFLRESQNHLLIIV